MRRDRACPRVNVSAPGIGLAGVRDVGHLNYYVCDGERTKQDIPCPAVSHISSSTLLASRATVFIKKDTNHARKGRDSKQEQRI